MDTSLRDLYQDTTQSVQTAADAQHYSMHSRGCYRMDKHKEQIRWSGIAGLLELANMVNCGLCGVH